MSTQREAQLYSADPRAAGPLQDLLESAGRCHRSGDHVQGARQAREAAELAEHVGDLYAQARALALLGIQLFRLGEYETAAPTCEQAVELFEKLNDEGGRSEALCTLTMSYSELGLHDEALRCITEALAGAQKVGDPRLLCWAYNRAGCAHDGMGDHAQAEKFLTRSLELARTLNDEEAIFSALNNLSEAALSSARSQRAREAPAAGPVLQRALEYCRECVTIALASGNPHRAAISNGNYGILLGLSGNRNGAFELLGRSEEIARAHGYRPLVLIAGLHSAYLLRLSGDLPGAIAKYRGVIRDTPPGAERNLLLQLHRDLAAACKEAGLYQQALEEFEKYHELERERSAQIADARARMLVNRLELEQAKLEAEMHRLRSKALEADKVMLEARALELDRHANQDPLTGLWNRRYVDMALPLRYEETRQAGRRLSIAIGDLDHFKTINDRFGHATGDTVLRTVAAILRDHCRNNDMVARLGGEEFLLVMPDAATQAAVIQCERLRALIQHQPWNRLHPELSVTISFGVGDSAHAERFEPLLAEADSQLYAAKRNGRNRVEPAA